MEPRLSLVTLGVTEPAGTRPESRGHRAERARELPDFIVAIGAEVRIEPVERSTTERTSQPAGSTVIPTDEYPSKLMMINRFHK